MGIESVVNKLYGWPPAKDDRETAWLDGLRGCAAAFVVVFHFGPFFSPFLFYGADYGAVVSTSDPSSPQYTLRQWWRLPFLRWFILSGHAQVNLFFMLSGFVLTWQVNGRLKSGDALACCEVLGSAFTRRWMRLYLPIWATTFVLAIAGFFNILALDNYRNQSTLPGQIGDFLRITEHFANPFVVNRSSLERLHPYDGVLWTVPAEFVGSLVIYLLCFATSFKRLPIRLFWAILLTFLFFVKADWANLSFMLGYNLSVYVRYQGGFHSVTKACLATKIGSFAAILIALIFMAIAPPNKFYSRAGWDRLDVIVPSTWRVHEGGARFWWTIGAFLLFVGSIHLCPVQAFFCRQFPKYLGRVSFMLYLTHNRLLVSILVPMRVPTPAALQAALKKNAGKALPTGLWADVCDALTFTLFGLALTPLLLFVAHWATVFIDQPSIRLSRRFDVALTASHDTDGLFVQSRRHATHSASES